MMHEEITERIIACSFKVYNIMGFGYTESIYEKCLCIELKDAGLISEAQKDIIVQYNGHIVGEYKADVLVEDSVIIELKSVNQLIKAHEVQLVNYLTSTGKDIGLLINFGPKGVEIKRKQRELNFLKNPVNPVNPV